MTKQQWQEQVRALAGYDPDTSCGWGGEAGASSAQLIIDDSDTPGFPALSVGQAEEMMGRKCQSVEKHGRYTRAYFGTL